MLHRLCGPPSIPLSFSLATVLPRRGTYCVSSGTESFSDPTPSAQRLRRGLPGYLIPFAPHALAPQRQCPSRMPPSPPTFFLISTHFTAPPGIPHPPPALQPPSLHRPSPVKPRAFTMHLTNRLRALLRPVIPNNARPLRLTAAAGTELAGASSFGTVIPRGSSPHRPSSQTTELYTPKGVVTHAALLRQACAHCAKFPTAASRRSLGRLSVPVWLIILSDQLPIAALVGPYPTN